MEYINSYSYTIYYEFIDDSVDETELDDSALFKIHNHYSSKAGNFYLSEAPIICRRKRKI